MPEMMEGEDFLAWLNERIEWDKAHPVRYYIRRAWYRATNPLGVYRDFLYRPVRTFIERGRRGWAVEDTWNLDGYIARVMAGSLAHLRTRAHGYPGDMTEEKWDAILAEMESGFRRWAEHEQLSDDEDEAYEAVQRSIVLMRDWFGHLWD